ncbi:MAG: hypothetical protein IJN67_00290 [Oscillospiraceae bacterium]|nr:hypothetical protein [Oscillospiraceae bacterium]
MKRKLLSFILVICILFGCTLPAFAQEEETADLPVYTETIEINSTEDFLAFARNCTLDVWSQDKLVSLNTDISLAGTGFLPIPTFGGCFAGNGHTITGLSVTEEIVPTGLFSYLQPTAVVKNLNVAGTVTPSGDAKFVGGIVGDNRGTLENVTFSGTVEGTENVGGIAGMNSGTILKCSAEGFLMGEKATGGIAGYNVGQVESCKNAMDVNMESVDPTIDPTDIDLDFTMDVSTLTNFNTSTAASDTGGIVGYSAGIILGCSNTGTIGYPHIGYNLGGIVGRNCGYVAACENTGTVYGRKDVGGIAGQIEPDIATILSPDYLQKLSDQFEQLGNMISSAGSAASAAGSEFQSYIQTIAAYESQAKAALNSIHSGISGTLSGLGSGELPSAPDLSGFSSLASAIQGLVNTTQSMGYAMGESVEDMTGSVGAISGQINSIAKTFEAATEDAKKEAITDVSVADIAEVKSGKVFDCVNSGSVQADLNTGGIVGVMGLEAEADPEDDLHGGGTFSQRRQYELKAIVQSCINTGHAESKQNYAGGICGRMELGLITGSENYGSVASTSSDYVGGIAGIAGGTIRSCYVKCSLSGKDYIGGIAGNGVTEDITGGSSLIADCYSMVEIEQGSQYLGAVSGGENGTYTGNYYVSDTLGGVNRVGYFALAEPISYEALLKTETIPTQMKKLTLTFMADGEILKQLSFDYGDSFDHTVFPRIPEKEGHYARWDRGELTDLHFDTVVTAQYFPHITALNSTDVRPNGNPVLFVQGQFQDGDVLTTQLGETKFITGENQQLLEHLCISIPADGLDTHTIRYLPVEDCSIYVLKNGNWTKADTEEMGSYLAFSAPGAVVEFVSVRESFDWVKIIYIAAGALILILLFIILLHRKKKAAKQKDQPQEAAAKKPKRSRKKWLVPGIGILLIAVVICLLYYLPQTRKAVETIRAYDILRVYMEQPDQTMHMDVHAKIADRELNFGADVTRTGVGDTPVTTVSENGRTLYYADDVVFLPDGTAYKLSSDAPDYSRILDQLLELYSLVDVEAVNGIYTVTAEGDSARKLLELLLPGAKSLLSDTNRLTVDLLTEADALTEIHFTGAGNLADSVKTPFSVSAVVKILPPSGGNIPQVISDAVLSGDYQAQEVYSDDLVRLIHAWKDYNVRNPIGADVKIAADLGPMVVNEDFRFYQWKVEESVIHGMEKEGLTVYLANGTLYDAEGHSVPLGSAPKIDMAATLDLVYQNFSNARFQCENTEEGALYTVTLNEAGMNALMTAVLPEAAEMDISHRDGTMQLLIRDGALHSIRILCGGSAKVAVVDVSVTLSMEMVMMDTISAELPEPVILLAADDEG